MQNHGVLRSSVYGLVAWHEGFPFGYLGVGEDGRIAVGELPKYFSEAEFHPILLAMMKGQGYGLEPKIKQGDLEQWRLFGVGAPHEAAPTVIHEPLTLRESAKPIGGLSITQKGLADQYHVWRVKYDEDPLEFLGVFGRALQRHWAKGRRAMARPLTEMASAAYTEESLALFAGTALAQTQLEQLRHLFTHSERVQPNHVACAMLYACSRWSPAAVENLICEAHEVGEKLSVLRFFKLLELSDEHPHTAELPVEFRNLLAGE